VEEQRGTSSPHKTTIEIKMLPIGSILCGSIYSMKTYTSIVAYIKAQPKEVQSKLQEMYVLTKSAAPKATESIKYGMPTLEGNTNLVHFAGMKGHLGFYPTPSAITHFEKELAPYSTSKGCVRFPYGKPLPKTLIAKMVRFRVKEDRGG
jgi:uncharacterized protein YdhG (YjbR/CyaY superfamily)